MIKKVELQRAAYMGMLDHIANLESVIARVEWVSHTDSGGQRCPWCKGLYPEHEIMCVRQHPFLTRGDREKVMVKIRLVKTLPLEAEHGAVEGLEVDARCLGEGERYSIKWMFVSPDSGAEIFVYSDEAEEYSDDLA